jgi:bifunctional non-homologous end joining protein LigD
LIFIKARPALKIEIVKTGTDFKPRHQSLQSDISHGQFMKTTKPRSRKGSSALSVKQKVHSEKKTPKLIRVSKPIEELIKKCPPLQKPEKIKPMLATLADKPMEGNDWLYEIKWDGYRALALLNGGEIELKSRNDKSFNDKFYPVYHALQDWHVNALVDGEIVVLKENGHSDFSALQDWRSEADGDLLYFLFDLLWMNGKDLRSLPLRDRKEILKTIVPADDPILRLSHVYQINGKDFFEAARKMGLEGIMAKRLNSTYLSDTRTTDWLKIKASKRQEVIIGGYTHNENSSKPFSALLVGVYDQGKLTYTGKIGTGFKDAQQREMLRQFKPLITNRSPFPVVPDYNKPSRFNPRPAKATAVWLKPQLVCEVSFTEMTADGVMRHPSFEGMRIDKAAKDVIIEKPIDLVEEAAARVGGKTMINTHLKRERKTLLNPTDETQVREVDGHALKFTNLSKIYWPGEKVTKRDMLNYYYQMAPYLLPYLKDRPQSLNRFPDGIYGKSFYQKDVTGKVPEWATTFLYHSSDAADRDKHFLVPKDEASILLMASMGCIELNPWSSRIEKPDYPDWCIIDLDPDKNTFEQVIEAARVTKAVLDSVGVSSYPKTSGSTGLHIYIPLGAQYTYEQSKEFARVIVKRVHQEIPEFTSIERAVSDRKGKMYLDFLQNRPKATLAAPYSLRPKPRATVSMPLLWEEVKKGLRMDHFTIFNAVARVREMGDLFKPVLGKGIDLEKKSIPG